MYNYPKKESPMKKSIGKDSMFNLHGAYGHQIAFEHDVIDSKNLKLW